MYAIVKAGGHQEKVEVGDVILVNRLDAKKGDTVEFPVSLVVDGDKVLSPGGLRHEDEAVRHKMLDAMGDLALAGAPLLARYTGNRAGHAMTNKLLRALFADPEAWTWETCSAAAAYSLPGAGVCRPANVAAC